MPSRKKPAKKSASHARRIQNKELAHGMTFLFNDHEYILQEYDCPNEDGGEFAFFQMWDITDRTNPQIVGNISRAVSCARV